MVCGSTYGIAPCSGKAEIVSLGCDQCLVNIIHMHCLQYQSRKKDKNTNSEV
jgi:hypothetical protein